MRLAVHTVICCCVFTTVLPLVKGATGDFNTSLKKRFRVWLQSCMRRDQRNSLETASEDYSDIRIGPQQHRNADNVLLPSSFGLNIRSRRSSPKSSGCALSTCSYNDLIYRLHLINNKEITPTAPEKKMRSNGYGRRRRRSLLDVIQPALNRHKRTHSGLRQAGRY